MKRRPSPSHRGGASVVLAARREDEFEELATRIESDDGEALVVVTDITNDDDIANPVKTTTNEYGCIDILVNNAGLMPLTHISKQTVKRFRRLST